MNTIKLGLFLLSITFLTGLNTSTGQVIPVIKCTSYFQEIKIILLLNKFVLR